MIIININSILQSIIKNYPDCCLAYNINHNNYSDEELLEECHDFFTHELMGICGCGDPDSVEKQIKNVLNIIKNNFDKTYEQKQEEWLRSFNVTSVYDNTLLLFMIYMLNDKKILEHGSSVSGSWLTELGEMYLYLLNNTEFEDE